MKYDRYRCLLALGGGEVRIYTRKGLDWTAKFPDAVTERGQKHLRELMALMEQGHTAEIVFTIQRHDCGSFSPADDIDPEYGRLLREAYQKGLRVSPFVLDLTPESVELS